MIGVAASMEHKPLLQLLASFHCRTIVDIGASRGQFALASHALIPDASIFSFEPLAVPTHKFRELFDGDPQVRMQQVAIGSERCTADVHVSRRDDSSSLLPIGELQRETYPGTDEVGTEPVRVERLENVMTGADIIAPALLKIDVQGYELEALKGCLGLLQLFNYAYVECSFVELYEGQALADEVIIFLNEQGFRLTGVYNLSYNKAGVAVQGDFLFQR